MLPVPEVPVTSAVSTAWLPWVSPGPDDPVEPLVDVEPPEDSAFKACPSAVSSFATAVWSFETCCSSADTVWSAASQVAWPLVVLVLALVQSFWACARSAACVFWSVVSVDSSLVKAVWSATTVALWPPAPVAPVGVVVVVDDGVEVAVLDEFDEFDDVELDSLSSSSTSFASSAATVDWAEDTDSLSAVASRVPSVCPAVTTCPGVTVMVATWPATWNEDAASLTGSTSPTTSSVVPMSARVTVAVR